ncbi:multidrug ABC transporter ATP-binding protein [Bacillus cereus]|uniref:ABC transporter ATP-binding protein n=1 Tax=Bacillus cereus TaxID=1396 RepID=UPI000BFD7595|nr:ABC transporter ATP-binding protein [Bacillus cereus]PGX45691.1 multidrug ABC transporter ATP-binding protein [Bacillus cereus]
MRNILSVEKIEKYYGNKDNVTKAIDNISFKVDEGEFVGIMGPSGSGKTTLLNCISTIDHVTTGKIIINNSDITRLKSKSLDKFRKNELGFVFQDFNLLDTLTAYENIALALTIKGEASSKIDGKIQAVAKYLDIEQVLSKYPYQISGGQKQRVASARAIVTDPSLVLADEPTGNLDSKSSNDVMEMLDTLNKEEKATMMLVTHDPYAASFCSRVIFIKDGQLYNEIYCGESRQTFYQKIMDVLSLLGGKRHDFSSVRI